MTEQEKQLLHQDLCARLPYGVILQVSLSEKETTNGRLTGMDEDGYLTADVPADCVFWFEDVRPYLRPLESMTEEERYYAQSNYDANEFGDLEKRGGCSYFAIDKVAKYLDWLYANHFDFRDLIEKGLAFEAPEGMYNIKNE